MKISVLQHVAFEGPGMIQDWAFKYNHKLEIHKAYLGELPLEGSFDLLVVMGGPMSANDTLDWIEREKELIKSAIEDEKLILGICLGAQLIAHVLGATIKRNPEKEIGWFPITCADNFLKSNLTVLHWHGETFDLPEGADLLATSDACKNQAFAYKDNVLGIQFHLEMDKQAILEIISHCKNELVPARFIQTEEELLSREDLVRSCRNELFDLLDGFALRYEDSTGIDLAYLKLKNQ